MGEVSTVFVLLRVGMRACSSSDRTRSPVIVICGFVGRRHRWRSVEQRCWCSAGPRGGRGSPLRAPRIN